MRSHLLFVPFFPVELLVSSPASLPDALGDGVDAVHDHEGRGEHGHEERGAGDVVEVHEQPGHAGTDEST